MLENCAADFLGCVKTGLASVKTPSSKPYALRSGLGGGSRLLGLADAEINRGLLWLRR